MEYQRNYNKIFLKQIENFMLYPLKKKKSIELNSSHRGYIPINTSTIRTSSLTNVTKPNQSESIIILHELEDSDPDIINQVPLAGPNQYPKKYARI